MASYPCEPETPVSISNPNTSVFPAAVEEEEEILFEGRVRREEAWPRKSGEVMLEGYVEAADGGGEEGYGRTRNLTDDDLEDLKGCLDLGFGFSYEEIPELCNTLPALELCYSMSHRFLDEHLQQQQHGSPDGSGDAVEQCAAMSSPPIANWRISSPGDQPEDVKARLKYWAQTVACTVRLCS
ncbi:uncharacterized protein LOC103707781 [Phoenix dactylifera]|uniref:Uncharacterized protein LOC103707781 n=1 Tax=Phoenix dactylifera TaxID=42345 RepID=A0A8B7C397_PHODC|nr:uncharacterized protein LOC103707781 [Phoenix dactylifera]